MKKKFVESVMVSMLIGAVITGCGKQEKPTETVYFSTEPSSESDAEITTEAMESERQTESISEEPTYYHIALFLLFPIQLNPIAVMLPY